MSISTVTSEALQLKLRQLLPSQQGFGTDLSASDTIIPVIDLTAAAEGSDVPEMLQTAMAFGSQTSFSINNGSTVLANTAGFYRIYGLSLLRATSTGGASGNISLSDGLSTKRLFDHDLSVGNADTTSTLPIDIVVFLASGETCDAVSSNSRCFLSGTVRQIADINGVLVQPSGFTPQ